MIGHSEQPIIKEKYGYSGTLLHTTVSTKTCPWPLGIETISILVGPIAYLQLSRAEKSAPEDFDLLSLLDSILPVYK
jgi:hypothetical protein